MVGHSRTKTDIFCVSKLGLVLLDLHSQLTGGAGDTADSSCSITTVRALNVVHLPGFVPQEVEGDAGEDTAHDSADKSPIVKTLGKFWYFILVNLAGQTGLASKCSKTSRKSDPNYGTYLL